VLRSQGLRLLNTSPKLKMRVRGLYFSLLVVPTSGTPSSAIVLTAPKVPKADSCLPALPARKQNPFASPLETFSCNTSGSDNF
jgi:hypothetical protein